MIAAVKVKCINENENSSVFDPKFDPTMITNRLKELLSLPDLIFQLEKGVTVIPLGNIESISVSHLKLGRNSVSIPLAIAASKI